MAFLNANIPPTYAQIRREYLYDCKKHHGEVEDCIVFGISAMSGRAILWHAIMENAVKLAVPNKVDYESGKTWGDIYG